MQSDAEGSVLGLEHFVVRLHNPTPRWAELYREEERRLRVALGELVVSVEHYGSTAIPEIKAKPILDILVGVRRFEDGVHCIAPLEAIGYEYVPEAGIPGDYTFGKGLRRTHLVHVVECGGENWTQALRFRDALRLDPALAREYEALKIALAEKHADSRADYTNAKTAFIANVNAEKCNDL